MINFIKNEGDYFSTTFFSEDFIKKVKQRSGFDSEAIKGFEKKIGAIKEPYYAFKKQILEGNNRVVDKINLAHEFHSKLLNALGYEADRGKYGDLFHFTDEEVLPIRHQYFRGDNLHLMILEMQPMIKVGEEEPDGLFNQRYNVEDEEGSKHQRYHRSQWKDVWGELPEGVTISPSVIEDAVGKLCLLEENKRPKYILLLAGNKIFLVDTEKWFKGALLEFDVEILVEEGQVEKSFWSLFYLLLSKDTLAPDSDMVLMDQIDEDSHKSAYEVTKDLKEGIIHAVEMLANEALYYKEQVQNSEIDETQINFANDVKDDALTLVYRLLFLFYAEARSDLDILPVRDETYLKGYSLEMLRDLEQAKLSNESKNGYFFDHSLKKLFNLLSTGYNEKATSQTVVVNGEEMNALSSKSFRVRHIDSPLFDDRRLKQLGDVQLRNFVWQDIICQLSLSKVQKGKGRGRISYANLGVNQLGSVYESLLAYRGFYADQKYIEVHEQGNPEKGTFVVPLARRDDFKDDEILKDQNGKYVIIEKGQFIYRLSGRDRKNSASFYTPEVLTKSTVKYTLKGIKERLEKGEMKALEILDLKLLEPAMGAGAFHNELINQLAEMYLSHRQDELKQKVNPDLYIEELQKVKAYIATNNAYGVDLNATAIELGKLSLWLNVIHRDMETPFFGYRLGHGNAVIGAWLKVYNKKQIIIERDSATERKSKNKKEWWKKAPKRIEFTANGNSRKQDEIYHFLLPDENMVPSSKIQMLRAEYEKESKAVTSWRSEFTKPIMEKEFQTLQKISAAIDVLLEEHYKFQASLNSETRIKEDFFGAYEDDGSQGRFEMKSFEEKEALANNRNNTNAPYYKLKMIMDYWCSLWFWDMRKADQLPDRAKWYADIEKILDIKLEEINLEEEVDVLETEEEAVQQDLFGDSAPKQQKLKAYKQDKPQLLKAISNAMKNKADNLSDSLFENERSKIVIELAEQRRFFHNELEFVEVFKERGGFDVIAGNPPWNQVEFDEMGYLSEVDPLILFLRRKLTDANISNDDDYINEYLFAEACKSFFRSRMNYPLNESTKSNLYKLFLEQALLIGETVGLIHDRGVYSDKKGVKLRKELYSKLKFLFRFNNELKLFSDVGNAKKFEVSIFEKKGNHVEFDAISNLFSPITIDICYVNTDVGTLPLRDDKGDWQMKGNNDRIIKISKNSLAKIASHFQDDNIVAPILPYIHSNTLFRSLDKALSYPSKLDDLPDVVGTQMLNENDAEKEGVIVKEYGSYDLKEFVLSGPNIYVGNPLFQETNKTMRNHRDYSTIDHKNISIDFLPPSRYKVVKDNKLVRPENYFHVHRRRAINTNERTLMSAMMPPQLVHVRSCYSLHFPKLEDLLIFSSSSVSIVYDFIIRSMGKEDLVFDVVKVLPIIKGEFQSDIIYRGVLLNALTSNYQSLLEFTSKNFNFRADISKKDKRISSILECFGINRGSNFFRRQLEVEIDVLTAMAFGMTIDELCAVYLGDFTVLKNNDENTWYDAKGSIVFTSSMGLSDVGVDRSIWDQIKGMKKGEKYQHTITKSKIYEGQKVTYYAPFDKCDRVEDYKTAWAHFEKIFKEK
jgi:hypothetical protein